MYGNTEIRKKSEMLLSLLVTFGWNRFETPLSHVRRSITLGDPATCMDIIVFLICNLDDNFGVQLLSLYKIDVPRGEENVAQNKSKDGEPDVDHTKSIRHGVEFILGSQQQINVRYRRVSKFIRKVLGIQKVYLQESQFVRQGFANKKLDMISDMIDAMRKEGNEATQLPSTGNSCPKTVCESQSQYVHPRDKNPPCLFHNISYMMEMDSESTQYISPEEQEQLSFPGSLNETLPIGSSFLIEEQEYGIPQTTTNPLFWTVTEYLPECRDSNSSEDECELDMHDHFAHEPSCILESLEFRAQQALKFIDGIHFK